VLGEEMGLVGTLLTLGLFAALVFTAVRIARQSNDRFVQLVSFGIATWIATQVAVNIGAVLRLAPVTGVPLPLVSYGGSSLIPTLLGMGILMSFARQAANK
jgi:cell division protein FtsW